MGRASFWTAGRDWDARRPTRRGQTGGVPRSHDAHPDGSAKRYPRLKAWHACHELLLAVYRESAGWPPAERHGLALQARRSAFSAAASLAEGSGKRTAREFRRCLEASLAALGELSYILLVGRETGLLTPAAYGELEARRDHASRLTWGLSRAVRGRARGN